MSGERSFSNAACISRLGSRIRVEIPSRFYYILDMTNFFNPGYEKRKRNLTFLALGLVAAGIIVILSLMTRSSQTEQIPEKKPAVLPKPEKILLNSRQEPPGQTAGQDEPAIQETKKASLPPKKTPRPADRKTRQAPRGASPDKKPGITPMIKNPGKTVPPEAEKTREQKIAVMDRIINRQKEILIKIQGGFSRFARTCGTSDSEKFLKKGFKYNHTLDLDTWTAYFEDLYQKLRSNREYFGVSLLDSSEDGFLDEPEEDLKELYVCPKELKSLIKEYQTVISQIKSVLDQGRKNGLYPGDIRTLLDRHSMDIYGLDNLKRIFTRLGELLN